MPIISVLLGYIFFKESLNKKRILSIFLVLFSIIFLIFFNLQGLPYLGLIVALSWAFYNLVRKKISVDTDVGLLIESLYILPFALVTFYFISINNFNDFNFSNFGIKFIPNFSGTNDCDSFISLCEGVELIGLGPTGMIFYITPTLQFILGFFYYNEPFSLMKFVSFIIIWIAVIIYLKDLYEKN